MHQPSSRACPLLLALLSLLMSATAAANGQPFAYFGHSVAISGSTALVGAYRDGGRGAAYVFVLEGGRWRRQARLVASDGESDDFFGWSVALDGDVAVIGAPGDDINGVIDRGSIYLFRRAGGTWTQDTRLVGPAGNPGGRAGDRFGSAIAVAGSRILVGAPGADGGLVNVGVGIMLVQPAPNQNWSFEATLTPPFGFSADSELGTSVALDGDTALLGAPGTDLGGGAGQGAAIVFVRQVSWALQQTLTALQPQPGDRFGTAVDLAGNLAMVGSPGRLNRGSAWGFLRTGTQWAPEREFADNNAGLNDNFGWAVAIDGPPDAASAVIGIYRRNTFGDAEAGGAYIYGRTAGGWGGVADFTGIGAADSAPGDWFGFAVDLDGDTILNGAVADDVGVNADQGSAYVHVRVPGGWTQRQKLTADTPGVDRLFANGFE